MRNFTDGEQVVFNKVDVGENVRGCFFLEIAERLVNEGLLEQASPTKRGFMTLPEIEYRRVE